MFPSPLPLPSFLKSSATLRWQTYRYIQIYTFINKGKAESNLNISGQHKKTETYSRKVSIFKIEVYRISAKS